MFITIFLVLMALVFLVGIGGAIMLACFYGLAWLFTGLADKLQGTK